MSQMTLHTLVGTALTDPRFCDDLLNGRRHTLLADFDLTDEEREAARATREASGDAPGGGPGGGEMPPEMATRRAEFENMTDEEREAARATMQAGGGFPGAGGRGGFSTRPANFLLRPLIELLEERARE